MYWSNPSSGGTIAATCRLSVRMLAGLVAAMPVFSTASGTAPQMQIDHVLLGIHDLDQGVADFEALTGVRPVYGGKHPGGTHNALVSLGAGVYLEIIAIQPGAADTGENSDLKGLRSLEPVGWAVSTSDTDAARAQLEAFGFATSDPEPGSRITPARTTLSWKTFALHDEFRGAPFFITWSAESPHPSTTSPSGCTLQHWRIASPAADTLAQLRTALGLKFQVEGDINPSFRVSIHCPKGIVVFETRPEPT